MINANNMFTEIPSNSRNKLGLLERIMGSFGASADAPIDWDYLRSYYDKKNLADYAADWQILAFLIEEENWYGSHSSEVDSRLTYAFMRMLDFIVSYQGIEKLEQRCSERIAISSAYLHLWMAINEPQLIEPREC
jgi:hypothetical protein